MDFLVSRTDIVSGITSMTLEQLGFNLRRDVHSVNHDSTLLEAMELIRSKVGGHALLSLAVASLDNGCYPPPRASRQCLCWV